jgi:hypothetical protein
LDEIHAPGSPALHKIEEPLAKTRLGGLPIGMAREAPPVCNGTELHPVECSWPRFAEPNNGRVC